VGGLPGSLCSYIRHPNAGWELSLAGRHSRLQEDPSLRWGDEVHALNVAR